MLPIAVLNSPFTYYFKWEYDSQALSSSEHVLCVAMFPIAAFLKTPPFTSHFKWEYGSQALSSSERVLFFAMLPIAVLISPFTYYFKWEYDS